MYEAFYGLRERPFNLTPDPKFLYLSDKHKEAFAHLLYGIKNHSGFVMLTGEIGTGKTTICRNLLNQIDPDTEVAFVFNPALNAIELLKKINSEFGIDASADNALELVETLNRYLLDAAARGRNCVLVIDEAQNLTPPVLEQIRLLSNLETEKDKLLQIILIGQPELGEVLALKELRQLNQRITARYHLKPLTEQETLQYIAYRLHVAGGRRKVQFDRKAVRAIFKFSGGVPRVINAICDRALLVGYTRELRTITAQVVRAAAREIRGERLRRSGFWGAAFRRLVPSPGLLLTAIVIVIILYSFVRPLENALNQIASQGLRAPNNNVPAGRSGAMETADASAPAPETPAAPAPAPTPERAAFIDALLALDTGDAVKRAGQVLLEAWKLDKNAAPPEAPSPASIAEFAVRNGLLCESLTPGVDQLLAINLPAFIKIRMGTKDLWLALAGADGESLRVSTGADGLASVTRDELTAYYAKEALILWRDPTPGARVLHPNASGEPVERMKEALRRLGRLPAENTSPVYDPETVAAISKLQEETGLAVDGVAGKQVRMVLASWMPEQPTPGLREMNVPVPEGAAPEAAAPAAPEAAAATPQPETAPAEATPPVPETPAVPEAAPGADAPETEAPADVPVTPEETEDSVMPVEDTQPEAPAEESPTPEATPATPEAAPATPEAAPAAAEASVPSTMAPDAGDIEKPATEPVASNAPLISEEAAP